MTDSDSPASGPVRAAAPAEAAAPGPGAPRKSRLLRYGLPAAVVAGGLLLTLVAALDGDDPARVKLPQPPEEVRGKIEAMCRELDRQLPSDVLGNKSRKTVPASDLTAAWGDPAVVLRCGVPKPVSLRPDDPNYDPAQNTAGVNGVDWTFTFLGEGKGVRFTTLHREVNVEVTVPASFNQAPGVLTAFAEPLKRTVPATMGEG
ncbi:DUF3515 family protein [Yinghuangia soli]|uniref:DUF3515 domain-containing protein n=1 Tax=Yinghuangia soli TaxID=2908204 RepID=A0AA41PZC3_9ACTN|nr:DUF3515 family protein [Yinghuangia soli]MCF2528588.1 DUF3515 domain-containing protein [Yinghuangia soli]